MSGWPAAQQNSWNNETSVLDEFIQSSKPEETHECHFTLATVNFQFGCSEIFLDLQPSKHPIPNSVQPKTGQYLNGITINKMQAAVLKTIKSSKLHGQ